MKKTRPQRRNLMLCPSEKRPDAWSTLFASTLRPVGSSQSIALGSLGLAQSPLALGKTQLGRWVKATPPLAAKLVRLAYSRPVFCISQPLPTPARYLHQLIENFTFPGTFVSLSFPNCQFQRTERGKLRGRGFFPPLKQSWGSR